MKKLLAIALTLVAALSFTGCGGETPPSATPPVATSTPEPAATAPADGELGSESNPIKIGVMGPEIQYTWLEEQAKAQGIFVKWSNFTDYATPNPAVTNGDLDLNQFQHIKYLADYNNNSGTPLVPLQATAIYPLGLYSKQFKSLAEIPQGGQIAIPNDETNQSRAIAVLADNGLLKVKDGVDLFFATPLDIDEAASKVKVTPVGAEQSARTLDDPSVAGAVINNTYALDADLDPSSALVADDPNAPGSAPFINIWAGKAEIKDNPWVAKLLALADSDEYGKLLLEQAKGSAAVVRQSYDELQAILKDSETRLKAHAG